MNLTPDAYQRGVNDGFDYAIDAAIEVVNCRYEQARLKYRHTYNDSIIFGEAMALRDILFELEEL